MGHPEDTIPFTVSDYIIKDGGGKTLKEIKGNYQTINLIEFDNVVFTDALKFKFSKKIDEIPVSVFNISIYN